VVDLGYAPGSWSQVAIERVGAQGTVVGIDLLPASPPAGIAGAIQGDFLDHRVRETLKRVLVAKRRASRARSDTAVLKPESDNGSIAEEGLVDEGKDPKDQPPGEHVPADRDHVAAMEPREEDKGPHTVDVCPSPSHYFLSTPRNAQ
jgi:23S rRNA U2552 (ribose-2'-O)-methylase RlmE/FtsJ